MKKLLMGLLLGLGLFMNTAFANTHTNTNVNEKVKAAFKQEFVQAKEVTWEKTEKFNKAVFKLNDDILTAYYSEEGELMGVVRNLVSNKLPINLQTSLKRDYPNFWITELFEFARTDAGGYFVTIESPDRVITLQSEDGSNWSMFRKAKKE